MCTARCGSVQLDIFPLLLGSDRAMRFAHVCCSTHALGAACPVKAGNAARPSCTRNHTRVGEGHAALRMAFQASESGAFREAERPGSCRASMESTSHVPRILVRRCPVVCDRVRVQQWYLSGIHTSRICLADFVGIYRAPLVLYADASRHVYALCVLVALCGL